MRIILFLGLSCAFLLQAAFTDMPKGEHKTLEIGASAPNFKLVGVEWKNILVWLLLKKPKYSL